MYYEYLCRDYPTCNTEHDNFTVIVKEELSAFNVSFYSFQFTIALDATEMFKIAKWCDENLKDNYLVGCIRSGFENKEDAMAFRLRWI